MRKALALTAVALAVSFSANYVQIASAGWCGGRSPAVQAKLQINWINGQLNVINDGKYSMVAKDLAKVTGMDQAAREKKVAMMYFALPIEENKECKALESVVFKDQTVDVGARLFTPIRMMMEGQAKNLNEKFNAANVPMIAFITADGKVLKTLEGKKDHISAAQLKKAMAEISSTQYSIGFEKFVKDENKLLAELQGLYSRQKTIESEKAKAAKKNGIMKNAEKIAAMEKEVAAEEKRINAAETALFENVLKNKS